MELFVLNENFEICGLIDDFSSLVWNRKYYDCGNFKLQFDKRYYDQFQNAKYIYCNKFEEVGIIETFDYKTNMQGSTINVSGRFLESKLAFRVINTTQKFKSKTTEEIIRGLINTFAISTTAERKIKNLELGTLKGLGKARTTQITGANLMDKVYELAKEDEMSIRFRYDFQTNKIYAEVWKGLDRRDTQTQNSWAIFSKNFENITDEEYSMNLTNYYNFAYIAGKGEGSARKSTTVDRVKPGEERRELYVDARDEYQDEETSDSEYIQMLQERGIEALNKANKVEVAKYNVDPLANLEYKTDFDLGDIVIYKNEELGLIIENRITEVTESYENGTETIDITFGNDYNIKKIKELIK